MNPNNSFPEWISVDNLPKEFMKVEWLYTDGTKDVGGYWPDKNEFATIDPCKDLPITHWRPLI